MTSHATTWINVTDLLRKAFAELSPMAMTEEKPKSGLSDLLETERDFLEFLEQNELELAWDELESMGRQGRASAVFWVKMSEAAEMMELPEKATAALGNLAVNH